MFEIEVADRQTCLHVEPGWVEEVVRTTLAAEQVVDAEIAVALLDDAAIHQVNREHLEHDYPTDVISFLYEVLPPPRAELSPQELRSAGSSIEGEILVSTETAIRMSRSAGWSPENELRLYLVHGLLHLCGYDDLTPDEQQIMRGREKAILNVWNLTPHYDFETH